jgi:hypothetical protein
MTALLRTFQLPLLTFFFFASITAFSQSDSTKNSLGEIEVFSDPGIDSLEKRMRGKNEMKGFRIQIFLGSYADAKNLRARFLNSGLGLQAYISQNTPDYVVRVGDFKTAFEAQKYLSDLRKTYPSALLVADKIEPPRLVREKTN